MCDKSDFERQMDELKKVSRSIIVANGNKMSFRSLLKEYKDLMGSDLPFNGLGYESLLDLIREMSDTFGVEIKGRHNSQLDYTVYCLPDPNTQHIVDLVQNQRHANERHKEVLHPIIANFHKNSYCLRQKIVKPFKLIPNRTEDNEDLETDLRVMPSVTSGLKTGKNNIRKAVCPLPDSRVITNEEKNNISQLMKRYPSLLFDNFEAIYHIFHKTPVDYKRFGFTSLQQFLISIPDLVKLVQTSDGVKVVKIEDKNKRLNKNGITNGVINGVTNDNTNGVTNGFKNGYKRKHFIKSSDIKEFLYILERHPNGIPVHQFIDEYYKTFRKPFKSDIWGFCSPIEMFACLNLFYLKNSANTSNMEEWLLFESTPELRAESKSTVQKRKKFDQTLKDNCNEIMLRINNNSFLKKELLIEAFNDAYYLLFDHKINPKIYGFNNLKQLLMSLSQECNFEVKEKVKSQPYLVFRKLH